MPFPSHAKPFLSAGSLALIEPSGRYVSYEVAADREGHQISFPCPSTATGGVGVSHQLVSMDDFIIDYDSTNGAWRASYNPPTLAREGLLSPNGRKLGFGSWPTAHELVYLGLGRAMLWRRDTLAYEVFSAADRGANLLRNSSDAPFFSRVGGGRLAGIDNRSALHHLKLPLLRAFGEAPRHVHVVLELLPSSTYRVWNSEGWTTSAAPRFERSPLAGPVGRGNFPASSETVAWTAAPTEPVLLEVDASFGTYRALRVDVLDLETLSPATTTQPPLGLSMLTEGVLEAPSTCEQASSRGSCAALGGPCGWCEQVDGVHVARCVAGGPARPCSVECSSWHFFDSVPPAGPFPAPPPPPSPPGLSEADLVRFEAHSQAAAAWQASLAVEVDDVPTRVARARTPHQEQWGVSGHRLQRMMGSIGQHMMHP